MDKETPRDFSELIGCTIQALWLGYDALFLRFDTNNGRHIYEAEASCCAVCWFEDILGVDMLLGGTVLDVQTREVIEEDGTRQEYDDVHGYMISTNTGYADIIFRNSSNGSYGGILRYLGATIAPPWHREPECAWTPITQEYPYCDLRTVNAMKNVTKEESMGEELTQDPIICETCQCPVMKDVFILPPAAGQSKNFRGFCAAVRYFCSVPCVEASLHSTED